MSETNTTRSATKDKLIGDMKRVVADAEELLHATANQAGEKLDALRHRLQANLTLASSRFAEFAATDIGDTTQDIRIALQKITDAASHAVEAATEAAHAAEASAQRAGESSKEAIEHATLAARDAAHKAVSATRDAADKALDAMRVWMR